MMPVSVRPTCIYSCNFYTRVCLLCTNVATELRAAQPPTPESCQPRCQVYMPYALHHTASRVPAYVVRLRGYDCIPTPPTPHTLIEPVMPYVHTCLIDSHKLFYQLFIHDIHVPSLIVFDKLCKCYPRQVLTSVRRT